MVSDPPSPHGKRSKGIRPIVVFVTIAFVVFLVVAIGVLLDGDDTPPQAAPTSTTRASPPTTTVTSTVPATTTSIREPESTMTSTTTPPAELTVGHWVAFAPFQDRDDEDRLIGFEIDLLGAIAERLHARLEWVETDAAGLLDGLEVGDFDLAVGSLVITEARQRRADFTGPYFHRQHALIIDSTVEDRALSYAELGEGDSVGVLVDSSAVWANMNLEPKGVTVVTFEGGSSNALDALRSGEIRGFVSAVLYPLIAANGFPPFVVADTAATDELIAFSINVESNELRLVVDEALNGLIADGSYQTIYDRWFSYRAGSVAGG